MADKSITGAQTPLTLHDVLDIKYLGKWGWSPDGSWIAWVYDSGGRNDLWLARPAAPESPSQPQRQPQQPQQPQQLTSARDGVSDFAWRPIPATGCQEKTCPAAPGVLMALIIDGELWTASGDGAGWFSLQRLASRGKEKHGGLAWSPDGRTLSYGCGGSLFVWEAATGEHRQITTPGPLLAGFSARAAAWAPDGAHIAFGFENPDRVPQVAVVGYPSGNLIWRSLESDPTGIPAWIGPDVLMYRTGRRYNMDLELHLLELTGSPQPTSRLLFRSTGDGKGPQWTSPPAVSPDGGQALVLLEEDGWAHHYLYSRDGDRLEQVTFGECEDFGHAGDEAVWSPDGLTVVYSSNRANLSHRHLWQLDIATRASRQLTFGHTTDVQPRFAPDGRSLAFVRCDAYRNMDIWVSPMEDVLEEAAAGSAAPVAAPAPGLTLARQLSFSMPAAWTPAAQVAPEEITYSGAQGWTIHAQLYRPHGFGETAAPTATPSRRYPALVWVHGGPVRQMRPGWHPMHSYAFFHAYHQYLLHRGYVVLVTNFRGGIGYGRAFRHGLYQKMGVDDVTDVVQAGRYLKSLPYVDPERVAVWGLSYGGYMTLHCLTQYPDEFAMGINIAGIWDFAQWTRWAESRQGRTGGLFQAFCGGNPDESPDLYRQASPCTFRDGLARPLINLHGTDDANVDFAQLDRIVLDCVALGKDYEAFYYPREMHTFRHKHTWLDAFPKIEREFAKRLRPSGGR
jgi:dipeptidyl aminopeptidase/acylaminoacyl peptidase